MRKLALVIAVAMASGRADALGLGDIELYSALNEPLNAEVRLLAEQPGELNNAVVHLAPNEEFARAGIERPAILSDIQFTIVRRNDGTSVVKITSTQPIREPFLDFVVQLRWQSGRLLREYTVLLDPPVFGEEKPAPVSAPVTAPTLVSAPQPVAQPEPAAAASPSVPAPVEAAPVAASPPPTPAPRESRRHIASLAPAPAAGPAPSAVSKTTAESERVYGPTRRNETLWNIAKGLRPDDSVSIYQMMMSLLKNNPQAFYDGNVNNLKAGYVLRVPEKAVVAAANQAEAVREAARQYERWQQAKRGIVKSAESGTVSPEPKAEQAQAATAAKDQEKETSRLRLVAPGDTSGKPAAAGGTQAELTKLRSELAVALESSDTAKRESDELRSRIATLEGQINTLQRLLTLKDQTLNDMQKRSGTEVPKATQAPAPASQVPPPAAPVKPAPVKPTPKVAEAPLDLFANWKLMGAIAGAGLLLLSVLWLIVRRRRSSAENSGLVQPIVGETAPPIINTQFAQEKQSAAPAMEEVNDAQMNQVAEEVAQHAEQDIPQAASDLDVLHTPEGDIDPVVEADVYLAYRRYQQAEALVQSALAKQPHRQDLQGKLLEIYYAAKNVDAFQAVAQTLYENLGKNFDDPLWQRVLPMGRDLCPEHELFNPPADGHGVQQAASDRDSLFDELSGKSVADARPGFAGDSAGTARSGVSQESYDLNLGAGGFNASPQEEKMDFDLNLGEDITVTPEQIQESSESLGAGLDIEGVPSASGNKKASAIPDKGNASESKAQNSWEIESAISDFGNIDFGLDDSELLAGTDVVGTKLDLARAYIDMGDNESARDILKEAVDEGNEQQKQEAKALMEKIS